MQKKGIEGRKRGKCVFGKERKVFFEKRGICFFEKEGEVFHDLVILSFCHFVIFRFFVLPFGGYSIGGGKYNIFIYYIIIYIIYYIESSLDARKIHKMTK